jgi:hypothetical protein
MMKKCKCGKQYEDMGFKTLCPSCYAKSKTGDFKGANQSLKESIEADIHRQVFVKVASEQLKDVTVEELIKYAKELEQAYNRW